MLLYIHVPFCRRKCRYCGFFSEPLTDGDMVLEALSGVPGASLDNGRDRMQRWYDSVLMEMAHWSDRLERPAVSSIFFGGGTPSLVPPDIIGTILSRATKYFKVDPKAEISMEANPESINRTSAKGYLKAGINRVSLGVQSLDDGMLDFLGRVHSAADVMRAYNSLRGAGFTNVGMDLIWGLPGQSVAAWLNQLGEVVRLKPEHISCYGLTMEPGTPLAAMYEEGGLVLPSEREQATMYMRGADILEEAGFLHYEVSNFARMGYQCRHNVGYWEGEDFLGIGPSATSTVRARRWTNPASLTQWAATVRNRAEGADAETLTITDRVLELIMLRLRTTRGLRVKAYRDLTGRDFMRDHKPLIHALHKNNLLRIRHGYVWLTRNGMLVSNSILERFFDSARVQLTQNAVSAGLAQGLEVPAQTVDTLPPGFPE